MKIETVSIIYQDTRVLLGMKKVRFGKGKYNGFGGSQEKGESLEETAIRETHEEAGIQIVNPEQMGNIRFHFQKSREPDHLVYFFKVSEFLGTPRESDEMKPEWFDVREIPYDKMWPDDRYWLPLLLEETHFTGKIIFNKDKQISRLNLNLYNLIK